VRRLHLHLIPRRSLFSFAPVHCSLVAAPWQTELQLGFVLDDRKCLILALCTCNISTRDSSQNTPAGQGRLALCLHFASTVAVNCGATVSNGCLGLKQKASFLARHSCHQAWLRHAGSRTALDPGTPALLLLHDCPPIEQQLKQLAQLHWWWATSRGPRDLQPTPGEQS
jgi:hypothetical protein